MINNLKNPQFEKWLRQEMFVTSDADKYYMFDRKDSEIEWYSKREAYFYWKGHRSCVEDIITVAKLAAFFLVFLMVVSTIALIIT